MRTGRTQILLALAISILIPYQAKGQSTDKAAESMPEPAPTWRIHRAGGQHKPEPEKPESKSQDSNMQRGINFSRHGVYKEAADYFTRAAQADPANVEAYNRRARAEWQLEMQTEALEDANWAIKLDPDYAEAFCTRAAIYNSMGRYQEAIADAALARDLKPKLRDAYILEAAAYRNLNQHREADETIAKLNAQSDTVSAFDEWHPLVDYTSYFDYIQNTVKQNWHPPSSGPTAAIPLFKIHRNGSISDLRMNNSTGDASADRAALDAVRSSAPFRPPPAGSPPDFDIFIVLDSPPKQNNSQTPAPSPPQTSNNSRAGSLNWNGAINQGINQGLNLMQRWLPH